MAEIFLGNIKGPTGAAGATFTPSLDANGNLSWTNNKGLTNPTTVNIKGPKGDQGPAGKDGKSGVLSVNGIGPDSNGNVNVTVSGSGSGSGAGAGGSGDAIPKTGERGLLAGSELSRFVVDMPDPEGMPNFIDATLNASSPDVNVYYFLDSLTVEDSSNFAGLTSGDYTSWTKVVLYLGMTGPTIAMSESWAWANGSAPTLGSSGMLIFHWSAFLGVVSYVSIE